MDKLKEYLLHHKADLDVDPPAADTWENIRSAIPARSGSKMKILRYAAAAAFVIALAGTGIWLFMNRNQAGPDTAKQSGEPIKSNHAPVKARVEDSVRKKEKTSGNDIARNIPEPKRTRHKVKLQKRAEPSDEIEAIDKSYSSLIDFQLKKLRATPLYAESGSYFSFYVGQFKQMDQDEKQVRNDIKAYGLTNEFLEQLINVYQQKLNLLKNLQTEINKMNNKVRGRENPSQQTEVHYLDI